MGAMGMESGEMVPVVTLPGGGGGLVIAMGEEGSGPRGQTSHFGTLGANLRVGGDPGTLDMVACLAPAPIGQVGTQPGHLRLRAQVRVEQFAVLRCLGAATLAIAVVE